MIRFPFRAPPADTHAIAANMIPVRLALLGMMLGGQLGAQTGTVQGTVVHGVTESPLPGVTVVVIESGDSILTDGRGAFALTGIPAGVYRLRFRAVGFRPVVRTSVVVSSGKAAEVHARLRPTPVVLEGITVAPSYFDAPRLASAGAQSLSAEEMRRAPGVQEDVVRAVALLPGVGVTTGGRNDLVVRGGAPSENLFLIDGLAVPNINHFGSQGSTGGPLSLVNIDFVESAEFTAAGFGARYGDRTASVTEITLREGTGNRLSGELNLSATGVGGIVEGPIGSKSTFWLGARRSYLDLLFKAAGFSFVPSYWDAQFKVTTQVADRSTVSVFGVGAIDAVNYVNETPDARYDNSRILAPQQRQYFSGLTWRYLLRDAVVSTTIGRTYTRFRTEQRDSLLRPTFLNQSREGTNSIRAEVDWQLTPRLALLGGNELQYASALDYRISMDGRYRVDGDTVPQPLTVDTSFTALQNATFLQMSHTLSETVSWTAGARMSYYGLLGDWRFAPRLGLTVRVARDANAWVHLGRYHQPPSPIWLVGDPQNAAALDPIAADHIVIGASKDLADDLRVQFETYYKTYASYPARVWRPQAVLAPTGFEDVTSDVPFGLEPLVSQGTGRVYGAELLVRKKLSAIPVFGLVSAAIMHSTFTALDGISRPGSYDSRFIGNALVGYRPDRSWELSAKFRVATGVATTPFITSGPLTGSPDFSRYLEGDRLPSFHALDVRIDRRWNLRSLQLIAYVDVQNVYGRKNVSGYRWDPRTMQPDAETSLGVLPSIGVNLEF